MIEIRIKGGLGNQLFQYAASVRLEYNSRVLGRNLYE